MAARKSIDLSSYYNQLTARLLGSTRGSAWPIYISYSFRIDQILRNIFHPNPTREATSTLHCTGTQMKFTRATHGHNFQLAQMMPKIRVRMMDTSRSRS